MQIYGHYVIIGVNTNANNTAVISKLYSTLLCWIQIRKTISLSSQTLTLDSL